MSHLQYLPTLCLIFGQILHVSVVSGSNCEPLNYTSIFSAEHSLYYCIFIDQSYLNFIRPVENSSLPVKVNFDLTNVEVIELNSKQGKLTAQYWTKMTWKDIRLTWDPSKFAGLEEITIPNELVWIPYVEMYNSQESQNFALPKVKILHNGSVSILQKHSITTNCIMRINRFPYDTQVCYLQFASTSYSSSKLQLISSYRRSKFQNINWKVNSFFIDPHLIPSLNDDRFSTVVFSIRLKRNSSYLRNTLILPSILISFLMCLLFFIDPQTRINLAIGLFIICALILNQVDTFLSINSGELPMIVSYVAFQMVMLTLQICMALVVANCINNKDKVQHVPQLLKTMLFGKFVSSALCLQSNRYDSREIAGVNIPWNNVGGVNGEVIQRSNQAVAVTNRDECKDYSEKSFEMLKDIRELLNQMKTSETRNQSGIQQINKSEWILLSKIVDRLCFFSFITIIIITTIAIIH